MGLTRSLLVDCEEPKGRLIYFWWSKRSRNTHVWPLTRCRREHGRMNQKSFLIAIAGVFVLLVTVAAFVRRNEPPDPGRNSRQTSLPDAKQPPLLPHATEASSPIRFDLADAGIDFRYFNSADPATPGARMFEFTGGGVGAIDFDVDGRPDLYFTQGCRWPPDPSQREFLDRLYRNLGDQYFDVTASAGVVEPRFSQGVACGDYDDDGFPDVYVGNIGDNQLFRNNGDGTFRPVSSAVSSSRAAGDSEGLVWTTSVAVVDVNADALPDLFDVNYVTGPDVFERICDHDGTPRVCSPTVFDAEPDRLWLNRGDGTFAEVSLLTGVVAADGTGLGVVAGDLDGSGRLSLFVANDERPNHFFQNVTATAGGLPRFDEAAYALGVATDSDGFSQACMGIAAGDANGDGRLDLFVTNYVDESNALYEQRIDRTYEDASRRAGLADPSHHLLGFGTQFLDADNDGWEDLIVTNGHVDDFRFKRYDFEMPTQVFRNSKGTFVEVPPDTLGSYFQKMHLGRGLVRLDWNGDGRDEFALSHLDGPGALLTNITTTGRHSVSLRLRATNSARDAIGTTVVIETAGRRLVRQLTAGDGYQASNERKLVVGIGPATRADSVTIHWPSGGSERFDDLVSGRTWLMIEGRNRPFPVTR